MDLEIVDADLDRPSHCAGVVDVLDSYASDPVGGGEPLSLDVRSRLPRALKDHPASLILLAFSNGGPVGVTVRFFGLSTEPADAVVWHYDEDYDRIADVTGQRTAWVAPNGSL